MANLNKQHTFTANTDAVAGQVNTNFDDIVAFINNNVIHRDGTKDFTAVPSGPPADPTTANHLTRKAYVDAGVGGANTAAANAHARANQAYDHAQGAHNALPGKLNADVLRHGRVDLSTNGAGDLVIIHGLGRTPASIQLTPMSGGGTMNWQPVVENYDTNSINVRIFNTAGGGVLANTGAFTIFWTVTG